MAAEHSGDLLAQSEAILAELTAPNQRFAEAYPGEPPLRQPVHVVYGGAQDFHAALAPSMGKEALALLDAHAPEPFSFAAAIGLTDARALPKKRKARRRRAAWVRDDPERARTSDPDAWLAVTVYDRVRKKLGREPVEDYRIDFEDGYGSRPDAEEDADAVRCGREVAAGLHSGMLPPFVGIRTKALNEENKRRAVRTMDRFFGALVEASDGRLPERVVVTLPKVPVTEQVTALVRLLEKLEERHDIAPGAIGVELMIELTQSVFDPEGRLLLPRLVQAAEGRCIGAHFGVYDYTASCGITAAHQGMSHPACDHARQLMKIAFANTGIFLSDGATNVMPLPVHAGERLSKRQRADNDAAVHRAWRAAFEDTQRSLINGFYQGWDMHAGQLPVRYAATFGFFLDGFSAAAARFRNFVGKASQATSIGEVFDDAATGQALLNYFLRAQSSGAVTEAELAETGLSQAELETRSFKAIMAARDAAR